MPSWTGGSRRGTQPRSRPRTPPWRACSRCATATAYGARTRSWRRNCRPVSIPPGPRQAAPMAPRSAPPRSCTAACWRRARRIRRRWPPCPPPNATGACAWPPPSRCTAMAATPICPATASHCAACANWPAICRRAFPACGRACAAASTPPAARASPPCSLPCRTPWMAPPPRARGAAGCAAARAPCKAHEAHTAPADFPSLKGTPMNDFCVATICTDSLLRAEHGVWRAQALALTHDAGAAAAHILDQARVEAEQLQLRASADAREAVAEAERGALERGAVLLRQLEQCHAQLLDGAQALAVDLALALFERALAGTTPRERLEASCRLLLREAPRTLAQPLLYLHPDDSELAPPGAAWELRSDATLARGACRLEAGGGEWRADFAAGASALRTAFEQAAAQAHD
ncbi:hypothetical protein F2P46_01995 [Massilia sp. CCM 8734]|nr:hypothetical protein [Massilia sp. CCM 8734]